MCRGNRSTSVWFLTLLAAAPLGCNALSDSSTTGTAGRVDRLPRDAEVVREGKGNLAWTAERTGTAYVQDADRDRLLISRRIERGQELRVLPGENRVRLDGETISRDDLTSDHAHRIYFEREGRAGSDRDRDDRPSDRVPSGSDRVAGGRNRELSFVAQRAGRVYLYDGERQRVVGATTINAGERFVFSPGRQRATVEGRVAIEDRAQIDTRTNYDVYFARE